MNDNFDINVDKSKNKSNGKKDLITTIIILLMIIILLLVLFICYDKGIIFNKNSSTSNSVEVNESNKQSASKKNNNEIDDTSNKDCNCTTTTTAKTPRCYGTYSGQVTDSGVYTYVFKQDGTFTADYGGASSTSGVFTINDNTISITGKKEITGPREEDPYYATSDYIISDDCSYILIDSKKLIKQ